jgi:hypothetical protein
MNKPKKMLKKRLYIFKKMRLRRLERLKKIEKAHILKERKCIKATVKEV